ncbi:MAG: hypothetical protein ACRBFS_26510, partial [Aureispira sp.]
MIFIKELILSLILIHNLNCNMFLEQNPEFDSEKWQNKSCESYYYRMDNINKLNLKGISIECLAQFIGEPENMNKNGAT